jgi:flagellar hook protein FlgE
MYDSLGTSHIMTTYYVKTDANTWDVYAAADKRGGVRQRGGGHQ